MMWLNDVTPRNLSQSALSSQSSSSTLSTLASLGHFISVAVFTIGVINILMSFGVALVALRRKKRKIAILMALAIATTLGSVLLAMQIGFEIAGI